MILEEIERRIPGFPIVLHGSHQLKQYTDDQEFGGEVKDAIGIPNAELRKLLNQNILQDQMDILCWYSEDFVYCSL